MLNNRAERLAPHPGRQRLENLHITVGSHFNQTDNQTTLKPDTTKTTSTPSHK
jgi:hypothetical protein